MQIAIIGDVVAMMGLLLLLIYRTKLGIAMRATSQNQQVAGLMGIDINRVIALTFVIGAGLAARRRRDGGNATTASRSTRWASCSASRRSPPRCWAASATSAARCWAACCSASSRRSARATSATSRTCASCRDWSTAIAERCVSDPNLTLFGSNYQDVFAFLVLIAVLVFRPSGLLGERVSRPRMTTRNSTMHALIDTKHPAIAKVGVVLIAVALAVLPFALAGIGTAWVRITNLAILYVLLSLGLNIVVGFAGLLDLGYIAFYAVGAYVYALLASPHFDLHLPFWVILPIGALVACMFGVLLGTPTLKLRGDYLAIVTLGFGEIIRIFLNNLSQPVNITNGPQGITLIDPFRFGSFSFAKTRDGRRPDVHRPDQVLLPAGDRAARRHRHQPAAAELAHRPRVGGDPRGRDRRARDGHQHAQHEAARVRDGRVVRRRRRRHVLGDPGLHQPGELRPGRVGHQSSRWSCWAAWATSGA